MAKANYLYHRTEKGASVKHWTKGVSIEDEAIKQLSNVAEMPFIHKHVAAMPDVHVGKGATVGSVIPTKGAIIPSAIGTDIGCGMIAQRLSLRAEHLPDNLFSIRDAIEKRVPHGRTNNGLTGDKGAFATLPITHMDRWRKLEGEYRQILAKHPKASSPNAMAHLGTLGGGNHFVELCLDEADDVWISVHSGSRGAGNGVGKYFIEQARLEMERYHILPYLADKDLAYMVEHTVLFDDYIQAVKWAQNYAMENRYAMMDATLLALRDFFPEFIVTEEAINCHHNYVEKENHYGANVWVTRKGAVRARKNDLGIIPGSMGAKSYIVRGRGEKESFCSCSHGAGRVMSRMEARKRISVEDHIKSMQGIEARLDAEVIDESPAAYKDIDMVMEAQKDLVEVVHTLRQVVNIKG